MRGNQARFLLVLTAGLLPLSSGLALAWILTRRADLDAPAVFAASGIFGVLILVLVIVAGLAGGRSDRESMEEPTDGPMPVELPADPIDPLELPAAPLDAERLSAALSTGQNGPPGPALRKLIRYTHPAPHRPKLVSLNTAVRVCVRAIQAADREGGRWLSFDPDPNVLSVPIDPDSFHLLLLNLITNARHAAGPSGHVDVRTQALDGKVLVAVRDDGSGVPTGDLDRIFEPFVTTRHDALGLGLAICRRIAAAHGGTIAATNVVPHGLEVGLKLPQ